jgi:hypothetical protein
MKTFRLTKVFEVYYDLEVEADDLDQAIDIAKNSDDWEEDDERWCTKRTWSELNEDGEVENDGVLTSEQLP